MHTPRREVGTTGAAGSAVLAAAAALTLSACGGHHRTAATAPSAREVAVPHLAGARIAVAERRLRDAGLVEHPYYSGAVGNPRIHTDCYVVLSQGPVAGTRLAKGSRVGIAVGVCP
jgi:beta-lactam-binding protein with PASTA domain